MFLIKCVISLCIAHVQDNAQIKETLAYMLQFHKHYKRSRLQQIYFETVQILNWTLALATTNYYEPQ